MERQADTFISSNEREFILQALRSELRIDGRKPLEPRKLGLAFALDSSAATVTMGGTRVSATVAATLDAPYSDRPNEGTLRFDVDLSPMASPAFEAGRPGPDAVMLARLVERCLRGSKAIDQEALCVLSGRRVWHLRVDVHVLDHCGNLPDACCLAALAALRAFRRPEVTATADGEIIVHPPEVREPAPLTLHHLPFSFTFGIFEGGNVLALDPCLAEEAAMEGSVTLAINPQSELCAVQKADGIGLDYSQLMRAVRLVAGSVEGMAAQLKAALDAHQVAVVQARVRRQRAGGAMAAAEAGRRVVVVGPGSDGEGRISAILADMKAAVDVDAMQDSGSSSGSEESSSSSGADSGGGGAAGRGAQAQEASSSEEGAQQQQRQQPRPSKQGAGAKQAAGARLVSGTAKRGPPSDSGGGITGSGKPRKRVGKSAPKPEGGLDGLEAIAAIIAGAGAGDAPVTELSAAIKAKPGKQARKAAQ